MRQALSALISLTDTQLFVSGSTVQIWARSGTNYLVSSVTGSTLSVPTVWGSLSDSPSYTLCAPYVGGFRMLQKYYGTGGAVISRSGPHSGPTLVEYTNLALVDSGRLALVEANGQFHGLMWKRVSYNDQLINIRGH